MRTIMAFLLAMVAIGCDRGGGSSVAMKISNPAVPGIVVSPSPSPSSSLWPVTGAVITATYGSESCASIMGGGVKCFDGTTLSSPSGLGGTVPSAVIVGSTIACAFLEPAGPATDCADPTDSSTCPAPATGNTLYCWQLSDFSTISLDESPQLGFAANTTGVKDVSVDGTGQLCLTVSSYSPSFQNTIVCGTALNSLGYLQ